MRLGGCTSKGYLHREENTLFKLNCCTFRDVRSLKFSVEMSRGSSPWDASHMHRRPSKSDKKKLDQKGVMFQVAIELKAIELETATNTPARDGNREEQRQHLRVHLLFRAKHVWRVASVILTEAFIKVTSLVEERESRVWKERVRESRKARSSVRLDRSRARSQPRASHNPTSTATGTSSRVRPFWLVLEIVVAY